jgi:hypothetical protein
MSRSLLIVPSLAAAILLGIAGCGDDPPVVACADGTWRDCTTSDGLQGEQSCSSGLWGACVQKKLCDENATMGCKLPDGKDGQKVCQGGIWTACGPLPGSCQDGTYKDCTTVDKKPGLQKCENSVWGPCTAKEQPQCKEGEKQACSTACGTGSEVCVKGEYQNCDAPKPGQEVCDGLDNNCDGKVDEVCSCVHGKTEPCYTGSPATKNIGRCKDGVRTCDKGAWGPCSGEVLPAAKEDCLTPVDDDCNGTVNDGCMCTPGQSQPCGSDVGECKKGTQACTTQAVWGPCAGDTPPVSEKATGCDGKDNDCDGVADNGLDLDSDESNNDCGTSRNYTVSNADLAAKVLSPTIYPAGDLDYFKITAVETTGFELCLPLDPQCQYLEVELVSPPVSGVQYQYSIYTGSCTVPLKTFTGTSKTTLSWEGACYVNDSKDFWIKVEAAQSSAPTWSCQPYNLKLRHTRQYAACPP